MKTRNFILFVLAAVVCGAFLCADSQASVCFAGDATCSATGAFEEWPEQDLNDKACVAEGYVKDKTCGEGEITYTCPYKRNYRKCCGSEFRYEACIHPLVQTGRCGTRVSCKCPDEYSVTSEYASTNNCQPGGGYCMTNDGTSDVIKYKTCTCDPSVFVEDGNSCPNNQAVSKTCKGVRWTNSNKTATESYYRVDCYCKRGSSSDGYTSDSDTAYPFASCTYGKVTGSKTCIDSNSQREYYQKCRSPEEACKDDGYKYTDCSTQHNCKTENKVTWNGTYGYLTSYNCIAGRMCPHPVNPSLYTCVFDKTSWCVSNDFTQTTSSKPTNGQACTTPDGIPGTMEVCPGNDSNSLFYYKCKIRCDQRMKKEAGVSLMADTRFGSWGDSQGQVWNSAYWVKLDNPKGGFKAGYHLFLRGDYRLPDAGQAYDSKSSGNKIIYANSNSANGMYASINGIGALYLLDPVKYSDCKEEYENSGGRDWSKGDGDIWWRNYNPKLVIPLNYANEVLSRDFNNIDIVLGTYNDQGDEKDWMGRTFVINKRSGDKLTTYVWRNMGLIHQMPGDFSSEISDSARVYYSKDRTIIKQTYGTKIKFMGDTYIEAWTANYKDRYYPDYVSGDSKQPFGMLTFHANDYHIVEFKDADMSESFSGAGPDVDAPEEGGVLVVDNSKILLNNVFSYLNVDVRNRSSVTASAMNVLGRHNSYGRTTTGMVNKGGKYCVGVIARDNSSVNVSDTIMEVFEDRYLFVQNNSSITSQKPVRLRTAGRSVACLSDTSSYISSYGTKYDNNYDYTSGWWAPKNMTKKNSERIMYSLGNSACMPYKLNNKHKSEYYYVNKYEKHCAGYHNDKINFRYDNAWDDEATFSTPGKFSFTNIKKGDTSAYTEVDSWGIRMDDDTYCSSCKNKYTCIDKGANYRDLSTYDSGKSNTAICSRYGWTNGEGYTRPAWSKSYSFYYNRGCDSYDSLCYGCSGKRDFLCSACVRCESGAGYSDWTDVSGGFATEQKVDPLKM